MANENERMNGNERVDEDMRLDVNGQAHEERRPDGSGQVNENVQIAADFDIHLEGADALAGKAEKGGKNGGGAKAAGDDKVSSYFTNLPIGQLICAPFVEMARGQAELCEVYIQTLFRIAFNDSAKAKFGDKGENQTRILKFAYTRPVVDEVTGNVSKKDFEIDVPLLSLVPIPAFTMNSADVKFDMEVNIANTQNSTTTKELEANVNFGFWSVSGNISGKVSNTSNSTYSNTQKATYSIEVHAVQQPATEGMSKLTSLLAETMEPITLSKS